MKMHAFGRLLPIETARRRLARAIDPIARTERVKLAAAVGRIAARPVRAPRPVPPVARATWDGYAVRSVDTRSAGRRRLVSLKLVGELYAEQSSQRPLGPGEAIAVATGASLPPGADGVAIFEDVDLQGGCVRFRRPVAPGERVGPVGHDIAAGTVLVRAGDRIGPAGVGAVAAAGFATVVVYAQPKVALLASGNELQVPGTPPTDGGVYECNLPAMAAVVAAAGGVPELLPPLPDDPARIEKVLRRVLRSSDLVLASGGSSVGERDHLPRLLPKFGPLLFHGLAVRPGKPTLAARAGSKVILGLPGHPASCLSNMYWLVLPVVRRLARQPGPGWSDRTAVLEGAPLLSAPAVATVVPLEYRHGAVRSTFHGSSAITSLAAANGFVILPARARTVRPGSGLTFHALDPPLG